MLIIYVRGIEIEPNIFDMQVKNTTCITSQVINCNLLYG